MSISPSCRARSFVSARVLSATLLFLVACLALPSAVRADDQDVITFRELIMKEMDAEAAAIGMILAGQTPPDTLTFQCKAVAASAKSALKAFEPKVPGGEAKPEVWAKWDDFAKRMKAFEAAADDMAKASEGNNVNAVADRVIAALPCKDCHDSYRNTKDKER
jgi:cytochrome c556